MLVFHESLYKISRLSDDSDIGSPAKTKYEDLRATILPPSILMKISVIEIKPTPIHGFTYPSYSNQNNRKVFIAKTDI